MAAQIKLIKKQDMHDDRIIAPLDPTLDLLPYLAAGGWLPAAYQDGKPSLDEVLTLNAQSATGDALADIAHALDAMLRDIDVQSPPERDTIFLRTQINGETNPRQAAVLEATRGKVITNHDLFYIQLTPALTKYQISLTRMSPWEVTEHFTVAFSAVSVNGGTIDFSGAALTRAGDMPGRIARMKINPTGIDHLNEFWIGFKSDRYGCDPAHFIPVWPLHLAAGFGADTENDSLSGVVYGSGIEDANALDGYRAECFFDTTPGMAKRVFIRLSDITADYQLDQVGTYQILLRARPSGTLNAMVRIGSDFIVGADGSADDGSGLTAYQPPQMVDQLGYYRYYPLGTVSLPASHLPGDDVSKVGLILDAEKISGTGYLYLDSLLLIPVENMLHLSDVDCYQFSPTPPYNFFEIYTRPDGRVTGKSYKYSSDVDGSAPNGNVTVDDADWSLPVNASRLVVVAQTSTASPLAATVTPFFTHYGRWANLRGNTS